ncbi:hypothetical protein JD844_004290 [Phrynosoma platyrhinos]|uniref:Calpain catalytic domain-containing protein n=1 Tax=Phrynosoma platyrhinos TaxID=52577 RepID=A0ABQ7TP41_PHRPL|nr:hypothetical protein JD844_004290 [Phrynosoma platyrhinos]
MIHIMLHQGFPGKGTQVIPNFKEQDWNRKSPEKHAGIFHFRFWCLGEWMDVVIDDRLPTLNNELIFCHSNDRNEFWSALLEKAYANTAEAIVDFTGAVTESIDMAEGKYSHDIIEQAKLFEDMMKVQRRGGLISCYIKPMSSHDFEGQTVMGLIKGHAYSVTEVLMMSLGKKLMSCAKSKKLFMIRLRNPWGKKEWNGAWSDESDEWKNVSKAERKKLGLMVENDGEFWMTFEDWCKNFTDVDICRIVNTSLFSIHKTWEKKTMCGQWTKNPDPLLNRSGGCSNHKATFLQNPQYVFDVKKVEDKVMISLQQKDRRIHKKEGTGDNLVIGFEIFKAGVEDNREYRMHTLKIQEKVATSTYIDNRMVFLKVFLKQGRYVLIPTTFSPGIEAEFILRLFTDVPSKLRELKLHKPRLRCLDIVCGVPQRVSQIKIFSVEGLPGQDRDGGKCKEVVWHSNILSNQFLGQVLMTASPSDPKELQKLQLRGRGGHEADEMPGHITVMAVSSDDLAEL